MEIPVLSRFIKGLRLFFESKRLRWFFVVFIFATIFTLLFREIGRFFPAFAQGFIAAFGGIFPTFFMIASIVSLFGLQRFVASEESYKRSFIYTIIWMIASIFVYMLLWFTGMVFIIMVGIAFLGWIGFQAYLASRSSLGYAEMVELKERSKIVKFAFASLHVLSYVIIIGSFIVMAIWNLSTAGGLDLPTFVLALVGTAIALGFNFLNGLIMIRQRKRVTVDNLSVLGLFISLYVAYFLYNILKPATAGIDLISLLIDIGISVFFLLYAMSNVGLILASRAHLDTRWKLSGELAATITFFLASGYFVVQAVFDVSSELSGFLVGDRLPDIIKLIIFPFVALVMEVLFIRRANKEFEPPPVIEESVPEPETLDEELHEPEAEEEPMEDISGEEDDYAEPDETVEDSSEEDDSGSEE